MKDLLSPEGNAASNNRDQSPPNPINVDDKRKNKIKSAVLRVLGSKPKRAIPSGDSKQIIISKIKDLYNGTIMPIEQKYGLYDFCLPTDGRIEDAEFDAKPMVLLIGQYSTGKTTFIRHLVGGDYPGMHIGPEPTTDKFVALIHGENNHSGDGDDKLVEDIKDGKHEERKNKESKGKIMRGNSLTVTPELPFAGLSFFGTGFLNHFLGSVSDAPLLKDVTLIDTPGVLSGEKQRLSRSYNFAKVTKWFADRSDLILLLFDAHKLDISDELKNIIETIRPHNDDKIRCILNKADGVTREQLVRVYGSLLWSMGKIFDSPEVVRVHTGSYWDEPLMYDDFQSMFENDERLLIDELKNLPKSCVERKVNALVKRVRMIKVHVCILTYLKKQTPRWFGKEKARENLIQNLDKVLKAVQSEYNLSEGDMPDTNELSQCLKRQEDFSTFGRVDKRTLRTLDDMILRDIPTIMKGAGGITGPQGNVSKKHGSNQDSSRVEAGNEDDIEELIKRKGVLSIIISIAVVLFLVAALLYAAFILDLIPNIPFFSNSFGYIA